MAVNYKAWVGWGFYGAASAASRANLWASWGMLVALPAAAGGALLMSIVAYYQRLRWQ